MSRLADHTMCPDCRRPLDQYAVCSSCGLRLSGPLAARLSSVLTTADALVEQLRVPYPAAPLVPPAYTPPEPLRERKAPRPRERLLPGFTAPVLMLGLGGLCVLVAAVVFLTVAWGSLGIGARTAIMAVLTALVVAAAWLLTSRGLRGAAETLWAVVAGMTFIDITGARTAGLAGLQSLDGSATLTLVGAALVVIGTTAGLAVRRTPLRHVWALDVATLGGAAATLAGLMLDAHRPAVVLAVAIAVFLVAAQGLSRALPACAVGLFGLAICCWGGLLIVGIERLGSDHDAGAWWMHGTGWPLLVAGVYAAVPTFLAHRVTAWTSDDLAAVKVACATTAVACFAALATGPWHGRTDVLVRTCVTVLVLAATAASVRRTWGTASAVVAGAIGVGLGFLLLLRPTATLAVLPDAGSSGVGVRVPAPAGFAAPWTTLLTAVALVALAFAACRVLPVDVRGKALRLAVVISPTAVLLGTATWLLESRLALFVSVGELAATAAVAWLLCLVVRRNPVALVGGSALAAYVSVVLLWTAAPSSLLTAGALTVLVSLAWLGYAGFETRLYDGHPLVVIAPVAVLLTGATAVAWTDVAGTHQFPRALLVAVTGSAFGLAARWLGRTPGARLGIELSGLLVALVGVAMAGDGAPTAMILTVVGTAAALLRLIHRDRPQAAWVSLVLLGTATLIRLDVGVRAPEVVTLPAACLLLTAGLWRMRTEVVSSFRALGTGLTLALLPSLLLALPDPTSGRAALVIAGGMVAVAIGAGRHWAAPLLAGVITVGLMAVVELAPYAVAVPRWVGLGAVGVVLLTVGATWEARRQDLARAGAYLADLV